MKKKPLYLFIDTSFYLTLGIVDSNGHWLDYISFKEKNSSQKTHKEIFNILDKLSLTFDSLDGIIYGVGPGSYTGLRVAFGMASVAKLFDKKSIPFSHPQIAEILFPEEGIWIAEAYKNEIYCHEWTREKREIYLLGKENFLQSDLKKSIYTHYSDSLGNDILQKSKIVLETAEFLEKKMERVLEKIICDHKNNIEPIYFRNAEKEFKLIG